MANDSLASKTWEEIVDDIEGGVAGATKAQMQSILIVPAKAAVEIGRDLREASQQIERFNDSTGRLTKVLIWLNLLLVLTTVVQAITAIMK